MIVVTGATGHLGRLVVEELLQTTAAENIVAAVRTPARAAHFAALGIQVREADYSRTETLVRAFHGASKLLLISGNELGKREQHTELLSTQQKRQT